MIEEVSREKWVSIYSFLALDIIQILLVSLLYIDESTAFVVGFDISRTNLLSALAFFAVVALLQITLLYITAFQALQKPDLVQLYPKFSRPEVYKCRFSREKIVSWTHDLAKRSAVEVDKIYLMNSALPNAFTFSLPLMGSVVVVHTNTLDVLNEDEVKAIIAHELGHIKNKDSIVQILARVPSFFIDLIYLYIYLRLFLAFVNALVVSGDVSLALVRLGVLLAFFILSRLLTMIAKLFVRRASRAAELLSDYHAASIVGQESTINALIRLGQRVEAITVLIDEIKWLESLNPERSGPISGQELMRMITQYPLDGIDEANARDVAPWVFLSTRLRNMREVYGVRLDDDQIHQAVEPALPELRKKRSDIKPVSETTRDLQIVDWRKFDYDRDRRLSSEEIVDLLKKLRENPRKMMFDREVGVNLLTLDHPDFRRRVLFIADEFGM
ncbi:MAG: M48 family metallopeptidase [Candidatus Thorarchaeota archaeon]